MKRLRKRIAVVIVYTILDATPSWNSSVATPTPAVALSLEIEDPREKGHSGNNP